MSTEGTTPAEVGSSEGLGPGSEARPVVERLRHEAWHTGYKPTKPWDLLVEAADEIERLLGERDVLLGVLRECDKVIATLEPESTDEDEALRTLLRTIKRLTLLRQADERDLLATHGA